MEGKGLTIDERFHKYAEMDANILADKTKLMSIEEFRQAIGWYKRDILTLVDEGVDLYDISNEDKEANSWWYAKGKIDLANELKQKIESL